MKSLSNKINLWNTLLLKNIQNKKYKDNSNWFIKVHHLLHPQLLKPIDLLLQSQVILINPETKNQWTKAIHKEIPTMFLVLPLQKNQIYPHLLKKLLLIHLKINKTQQ